MNKKTNINNQTNINRIDTQNNTILPDSESFFVCFDLPTESKKNKIKRTKQKGRKKQKKETNIEITQQANQNKQTHSYNQHTDTNNKQATNQTNKQPK